MFLHEEPRLLQWGVLNPNPGFPVCTASLSVQVTKALWSQGALSRDVGEIVLMVNFYKGAWLMFGGAGALTKGRHSGPNKL